MYDGLTGRYTFSCPRGGEVRVPLSSFRLLERLPGTAHPAVYKVTFACGCREEHAGLVSQNELDWAPVGATDVEFWNVMTARLESAAAELLDQAARRIEAGQWPWSFFCYPEERPRPVVPSSFWLLAPADASVGIAVRCPACTHTSVNLVSRPHVDVPFFNDASIGVVEHVFASDHDALVAEFSAELDSASFDARRLELGP